MIFTGQPSSSNIDKGNDQEELTSSNHITVQDCEDSESEIELAETPETLEDGGQAIVDDLKELYIGTVEKPRPIYVS